MSTRTHHVLQRVNNRRTLLFDDEGRRLFLHWPGEAAIAVRSNLDHRKQSRIRASCFKRGAVNHSDAFSPTSAPH
jgi:hypothetical protein